MQELEKSLNELNEILKSNELVQGQALKVTDHSKEIEPYLSDEAIELCKKTVKSMISGDTDGTLNVAVFFAMRLNEKDLAEGQKALAEMINRLAEEGLLKSVLAPVSSLDLVREFGKLPSKVLFFFPHVPADKEKYVKENFKFSINEGETGSEFKPLEVPLAPGEFLADVRLWAFYPGLSEQTESFDIPGMLFDEINRYLTLLPPGTEVMGVNKLAITDLSTPYEVKFYNPLLTRVREVQLDYIREVAAIDGGLKQFPLLVGIRYIGKDGKPLYGEQ